MQASQAAGSEQDVCNAHLVPPRSCEVALCVHVVGMDLCLFRFLLPSVPSMLANTEHSARAYSRGLALICLYAKNLLGAQMSLDAERLE